MTPQVIFASAPPPGKGGGWPCFWVSLIYIGLCVMVIADLAKIFGCLIGLKEEISAMTIVTLGTSQIDLFASKIAAISDPGISCNILLLCNQYQHYNHHHYYNH